MRWSALPLLPTTGIFLNPSGGGAQIWGGRGAIGGYRDRIWLAAESCARVQTLRLWIGLRGIGVGQIGADDLAGSNPLGATICMARAAGQVDLWASERASERAHSVSRLSVVSQSWRTLERLYHVVVHMFAPLRRQRAASWCAISNLAH